MSDRIGSASRAAARDLERAEASLQSRQRRAQEGAWGSLGALLSWTLANGDRMGSPQSMSLPVECVSYVTGYHVPRPNVDGGKGGDLDSILALLNSSTRVLQQLGKDRPELFQVLVLRYRGFLGAQPPKGFQLSRRENKQGALSIREIADRLGRSKWWVEKNLPEAQAEMEKRYRTAGLIV